MSWYFDLCELLLAGWWREQKVQSSWSPWSGGEGRGEPGLGLLWEPHTSPVTALRWERFVGKPKNWFLAQPKKLLSSAEFLQTQEMRRNRETWQTPALVLLSYESSRPCCRGDHSCYSASWFILFRSPNMDGIRFFLRKQHLLGRPVSSVPWDSFNRNNLSLLEEGRTCFPFPISLARCYCLAVELVFWEVQAGRKQLSFSCANKCGWQAGLLTAGTSELCRVFQIAITHARVSVCTS